MDHSHRQGSGLQAQCREVCAGVAIQQVFLGEGPDHALNWQHVRATREEE